MPDPRSRILKAAPPPGSPGLDNTVSHSRGALLGFVLYDLWLRWGRFGFREEVAPCGVLRGCTVRLRPD